jgi:hypothetical protein
MKPADVQKDKPADRPAPPRREERADDKAPETLDFTKLDLSIEKVEERIAPSETNVFDK